MQKLLNLSQKTAMVTGASGGLGPAIARKLAAAGARIILHCSNNSARLEDLQSEINAERVIACNLASEANIKTMMEELEVDTLLPDLLINNAALQTLGAIEEADEELWNTINNVNLGSVYALTKYTSNALIRDEKAGAIVNIASIEGLDPTQNHAHYAASKAALIMFTRASALELGKHNIRVNAVAPGLISRPSLEQQWPEGVKRWQSRAPLTRLGTGEDVANGVLFLLSPAADWISGNTLVIDGGMSSQSKW